MSPVDDEGDTLERILKVGVVSIVGILAAVQILGMWLDYRQNRATERIVSEGRLWTGGNPVLRYAFENVRIQTDAAENLKPDRAKSKGRIDPLVAIVMAIDGYDRLAADVSPYEEHGLIIA